MKRWRNDELVVREIFGRPRKINRDVFIMQGGVEEEQVLAQVQVFVGLAGLLHHPFVVMAVENAYVSLDVGVLEWRREQFHFVAKLAHFLKHTPIRSRGMR